VRDRLLRERISGSGKSVLLLGPRQVGKSTLCRSLGPDFLIDLADEQLFLAYLRDPGRLKRELAAVGSKGLVVIDEIQRIPSLLNTVQSILDDPANSLRFVLTGST